MISTTVLGVVLAVMVAVVLIGIDDELTARRARKEKNR